MITTLLPDRLTVYRLRLFAGLTLGVYVTLHLTNHALGLISLSAQEAARPWFMAFWHSPPGQVLLYGAMIIHAILGLYGLAQRRHYRLPASEWIQIGLGLLLPYLLLVHVVNTRGTRILTHIDIDYTYEIANLWIDPVVRIKQVILVLLVWGHFVAGLHFWLRFRPWYRKAFSVVLLAYVILPAAGLLGFSETGKMMTAHARVDPAWWAALKKRGIPADPDNARIRAALRAWAGTVWIGIAAAVAVLSIGRNIVKGRRRIAVSYTGSGSVWAPVGMTLLEVSRMARRPHMSVCGGRARCTTCRVQVIKSEQQLPPPSIAESRALERIGAPPGLRLACQTRPRADVEIKPLLNPTVLNSARGRGGGKGTAAEFGQERDVTVLFIDVRGSTKLAEKKLPFDVVFLMNQFFAEMAEAVERTGGHYSNFTGDGLMALFGLTACPDKGSRAALACAASMLERLERINSRIEAEVEAPIGIGIGIHTGLAIVGRMGPPKTPVLTALGDTVNTTARLEGLTKDFGRPIIVSQDSIEATGLKQSLELHEVQLRGRATKLLVAALERDEVMSLLASEPAIPAR